MDVACNALEGRIERCAEGSSAGDDSDPDERGYQAILDCGCALLATQEFADQLSHERQPQLRVTGDGRHIAF